jgi:hypothetical protein
MSTRQHSTNGESGDNFHRTNAARDLLAELAEQVDEQRTRISLGSRVGRPVYELVGASCVERATLDACLKIRIDEARRHWTSVRAVIRAIGGSYLLVVRGKPRAVLRRHPEFDARFVDAHVGYFLRRGETSQPDLAARVERLEHVLDTLAAPAKRTKVS